VCLDGDLVPAELVVRSRRAGDVYGPGGTRLKKLLLEARMPREVRDRLPVVATAASVVWIPGFEPPNSLMVRPETVRSVILEARAVAGRATGRSAFGN
jgi:tRNA(Ile)-lysidine synthase